MAGYISTYITLGICIGFPVLALLYLLLFKRRYLVPFLLGVAAFLTSQVLIRMPFLEMLGEQRWFQNFAQAHVNLYVILIMGLTAGIAEEGARWLCMHFALSGRYGGLPQQTSLSAAVAFGIGHGGFEALWIAGIPLLDQFISTYPLYRFVSPLSILPIGAERIFTIIIHVGLSVLVMQVVKMRKPVLLLLPTGLHMIVNSVAQFSLMYSGNILVTEMLIAIMAVAFLIYINSVREREKPNEEFIGLSAAPRKAKGAAPKAKGKQKSKKKKSK